MYSKQFEGLENEYILMKNDSMRGMGGRIDRDVNTYKNKIKNLFESEKQIWLSVVEDDGLLFTK